MQCFNYEKPDWSVLRNALLAAGCPDDEVVGTMDQFMWMGEWKEGEHSFKHRDTRQYARLRSDSTPAECKTEIDRAMNGGSNA